MVETCDFCNECYCEECDTELCEKCNESTHDICLDDFGLCPNCQHNETEKED